VELFLNGQSLGKQTMKRNSELKWMVKYAPGTLSAKGFKGGKVIAETKVETTGEPTAVQLTPNRAAVTADGKDVSVITVSIADSQGRIVPVASNKIHFELSGPGKILGVGNGDPSCHEPDQYIPVSSNYSKTIGDWRWKSMTNIYGTLAETAETFDDSSWQKADVKVDSGPLQGQAQAVFRARVNVSQEQLNAMSVVLNFGMIDEDGIIFVNGQKAGESHNWQDPASVDVKKYLRAGENTIAVTVANWNAAGGLNKGVALQFEEKPAPLDWQRSVFNGLAQVIVQSAKEAGEIKVTARSEGLKPAEIKLTTGTGRH
jgi:beta-galactosidase